MPEKEGIEGTTELDREVIRCQVCGLVQYRTLTGDCRRCLRLLRPNERDPRRADTYGTGELMRAARFFFAGQLKPVIDRTFTLAAAAAAHQRMEVSGQFGKIVLEVP